MSLIQRFLLGNRVEDDLQVGLFLKNDGTVWLRNPDGSETQLPGGGGGSFPPAGWYPNSEDDGSLLLVGGELQLTGGHASHTFQTGDAIATFVAQATGVPGTAISVLLQGLTDDEALSVTVVGNAITVTLETSGGEFVSTAQNIADAVAADDAASALVSVVVDNDGVIDGQAAHSLKLADGFIVDSSGTVTITNGGVTLTLAGNGGVTIDIEGVSDADLFRAANPEAGAWGLTKNGLEYFQVFDAGVDDGDVSNSQRVQWFDDTSGSPAIHFKERDVDGNLHSGRAASYNDSGDAFVGIAQQTLGATPTGAQIRAALVALGLVAP